MSSGARRGFWAAIIHGILALLAALVSPLAGIAMALIFFAFAWGIRKQRAWAAIAAVCFLVAPLPIAAGRLSSAGGTAFALAAGAAVELLFAFFLAGAAIELWHDPRNRATLPWAPLAALFVVFWIAVRPFAIGGGSMENTILKGDQILVESVSWQLGRTPDLGDLVVVLDPLDSKQRFIKRVVAGPGDRIRIRNKQLFRNGEEVSETYAIHSSSNMDPFRDNFPAPSPIQLASAGEDMLRHVENGELTVPEGKYFVLGDNRDDSLDSRYWGFIPLSGIVGTPLLVYASYSPDPRLGATPISFKNTRWNRLGKILR